MTEYPLSANSHTMSKLPEIFGRFVTQIWFILFPPGFFLYFMAVFQPFGTVEALGMGRNLFFFNTVMLMCIMLVVLLISRMIFFATYKKLAKNWWQFIVWAFVELSFITFFFALYLCLMEGQVTPYFKEVAICMQYSFLILLFPYFGITMVCLAMHLHNKNEMERQPGRDIVRFMDNSHKVKLVVSREAILYIRAEENYVRIHYVEDGNVRDFQLRTTMNSLAALAKKNGLFRCQRSYYVNPAHIIALRKDANDMISAELDTPGSAIPVSRNYYHELSEKL